MIAFFQSFFTAIGDFFTKIWEFLVWIWDELTQFYLIIKPAIHFFLVLVGSIPPFFYVFAVAMLLVMVIYIIIGRNAGGD